MRFTDKQFVLAGKFEAGDKGIIVKQMIEMCGGSVKDTLSITKDVSYVVLGKKGNSSWKDSRGPQALEAEKRQAAGQEIAVITEQMLFESMTAEGITKDMWAEACKQRLSDAFMQINKTMDSIIWVLDSSTKTLLIENEQLPDVLSMIEDAEICGFRYPIPTKEEQGFFQESSSEKIVSNEISESDTEVRVHEYGAENLEKILPWGSRVSKIEHISAPKLTEVPPAFFSWAKNVKDISLPSVRVIRNGAFYECSSLQAIEMPEVIFIGNGSFCQCRSLESKLALSKLEYIGPCAFSCCLSLTSLTTSKPTRKRADGKIMQGIGFAAKCIGEGAFLNCAALKTLGFDKGGTEVGKNAFHNCEALPDNIRKLGDERFAKNLQR